MPGTVEKRAVILLIEDDETDVFFLRRALNSLGFTGDVRVVVNAWQARDYMEGRGAYSDRTYFWTPNLVLCDLHMPGATGLDFLKWLRDHPLFQHIPLVIWSGSLTVVAANGLLQAGANACVLKTPDFKKLCANVQAMLHHLHPSTDGASVPAAALSVNSLAEAQLAQAPELPG